jgi:hypothetical protein
MRTEIEQRFESESKVVPVLRESFMARVVRWTFSTRGIWDYEDRRQYGFEWDPLSDPEQAYRRCGYDETDRPIVLQHLVWSDTQHHGVRESFTTQNVWAEELISHHGDTLDVTRLVRGQLERVSRMTFCGRLLVEEEEFAFGNYSHTRWQYQDGRKVLQQSISDKGQVIFEIAFSPHGEETYSRVRRDGTRFQLGQPLPKGVTIKSLKETIRSRLLALIPEVVVSAKIQEPVYCVALAYDGEGNDVLPPIIGIGLESERLKWLAEDRKGAWRLIWNPAEFHHYEKSHTQLEDDDLEEACDYLNSKIAEQDSAAQAIKLLVQVAAALNNASWSTDVQRTPDFVVYAVDFELKSLRKNFKTCLPHERFAAFKAKEWI